VPRVPVYHPPIFNDPYFTAAVMLGWIVMVAGAVILLLVAMFYASVLDNGGRAERPRAFRVWSALGAIMFVGGLAWQIAGYVITGVLDW